MARFMDVANSPTSREYKREACDDPLETHSDLQLYKEYRLDKEGILYVTNLVKGDLPEINDQRGQPVKLHIVVMAALLCLASNCFQIRIARSLRISQATVSRSITAFVMALSSKVSQFVMLPRSVEEKRTTMNEFYGMASFPGVVSAVDGSHVKILAPAEDAHQYRCRKGYTSLNVQLACNARGIFTNVVCRWPGSSHDSYILKNSELYRMFESGISQGIILGDSGYPCRPWLMTPYPNPTSAMERQFNTAQKKNTCNN
jgi:nuclease HARBI1